MRRHLLPFACTASTIALVAIGAIGCDGADSPHRAESAGETIRQPSLETRSWSAPDSVDLTRPDDATSREFDLTELERFPPCRELFEPEGTPAETFPVPERWRARALAGCRPEAYRRDDSGRRYIAYDVPNDAPSGTDLRLLYYGPDDTLQWSYRIDRSDQSTNFEANFRESFVVPLHPHLVCVGTLWAGATRAICLEAETGEREWDGELSFWSGMPLRGDETSLVGADINGLTRRYPYSGVEMQRRDFEHRGGRGGLYLAGPEHLLFTPDETDPQRLTAYAYDGLEPRWRVELPGHPDSAYDDASFPELGVAAGEIDGTLYGLELSDGSVRWAWHTDDRSPIVALDSTLYALVRRDGDDNLLYALEPRSGEVRWHGSVPSGTLHLHALEGRLMLRSVRAVQRVRLER